MFVIKLTAVLKDRSHFTPESPCGFPGSTPCKSWSRNRNTRPIPLKISTLSRYFFQLICSSLSTRITLYTRVSHGVRIFDKNVFSPYMTLLMYAPSGIARSTKTARYSMYCISEAITVYLPSLKCRHSISAAPQHICR